MNLIGLIMMVFLKECMVSRFDILFKIDFPRFTITHIFFNIPLKPCAKWSACPRMRTIIMKTVNATNIGVHEGLGALY